MRHRAEVHIPSLSAHCRDPAAKTGDVEDMRVSDYCEWTLICKSESVADLPSALNASSSFMPRSNADEKTCAHTDRLLVTCRKAVVVGWLRNQPKRCLPVGSGAETVDQLLKLHGLLLKQPTAHGTHSPSARA